MAKTINKGLGVGQPGPDQPFLDTTAYGSGPDDSVSDVTENAAITHHVATVNGISVSYTATAGHLVAVDPSSSKPAAKVFYVAFTADGMDATTRPVTFFYNGGPGSSSVFLLLGSFAPRRIRTSMPGFTPPPPYAMEDNPDSLIERSDLVYINPVGTGYSAAIAPFKNRDFWGVDQDAVSIKQFIKRYLSAFNRWNSPRFLLGESYGTARSCVLAWLLHEDGLDLNGITLQSSVLDYPANFSNAVGLMPTFAADAWFHKKTGIEPLPADLASYMETVTQFAQGPYSAALNAFPKADPVAVETLSRYLGLPASELGAWRLNVEAADRLGHSAFLIELLQDQGLALGAYDGRVTGIDTGISAIVSPDGGMNDPTMAAVGGVYTTMWNSYLSNDLKFTATSNFIDLNDQAFQFWDFSHTDPTGAVQKPDSQGNPTLYTAGDLAATMAANPDLLVLSANGYYDSVTPFFQTKLTLDTMPLEDARVRANLAIRNYPSGHMIYLDGASRTAMKADLAAMYDRAVGTRRAQLQARAALSRAVPNIIRPYFKLPGVGDVAFRPAAAGAEAWNVPDLCRAYGWPSGLVGGGVIAIIEFGGGWVQKDIDAYFRSTGLPAPTIVDVPIGGGRNDANKHSGNPAADPDREVALDIEVAAAAYSVATGDAASIRVYWADGSDWGAMATAIIAAAADGCDVCSVSWGSDEANWTSAATMAGTDYPGRLNKAAEAATKAGMIVFAASGDNDSSDGGADPANVDLPSSSPFVVGCGGTMKPHGANAEETVWNDDPGNPNGSGTGGGFSELFRPMPAWQAGAPHGPGRMVPDVSASADPYTGYGVFVHGRQEVIGGTSAVAPLYAGLFAAFGRKLGMVAPQLWLNHTCFNDITSGDNGYFRARIGPDPCTGIGTPIADKLGALFEAPRKPAAETARPAPRRRRNAAAAA
ncbi:S10 family serine carboxypeptidase-like protein [Mesorhizobium sp. CA4]|uniref:S10 family serine carboxypeptidase-like protein n=1 Tax=Mesorhizobium sp. CA4 TaxID=588499 RepID=UPI001CD0B391|nr:S8 family serine peptidase [Mesorhizobium sp. CA4]MBZ9820031.1 S8 family serine peptidase [Mesorhizobium sp. CA4]